jgi:hypothetical protein
MAKRKKRAGRHDPRNMTKEQFVQHCMERYMGEYWRTVRRYAQRDANSPYTAIERLHR